MKRLIPFLTVLIVATVLFAFASRTDQAASIRQDVRRRVAKIRDDIQEMTSDVDDVTDVEVETVAD
jgi:sensor domain CHASE-containing protein